MQGVEVVAVVVVVVVVVCAAHSVLAEFKTMAERFELKLDAEYSKPYHTFLRSQTTMNG